MLFSQKHLRAMNTDNIKEKYVDPFTDFGFKRLFGEEANKDLLIDFLNQLLNRKIKSKTSLSKS